MKVTIISNDFRVYWKGRLLFLKPYLAKQGIQLHAIELFGKGSPYAFDSYNNDAQWWQCLFPNKSADELTRQEIAKALFLKLDELAPDVLIASPITFFAGALGLRWSKKNRKKFIMFDDAKPLKQFKRNFLVQWVRNTLTRQADALWLPSKDYDEEYPTVERSKTDLFYGFSCIDNNFFKPKIDRQFVKQNILCVARLVTIKNIAGLLKAWQGVERSNNYYQLQIIGDGPDMQMLTQLSADLDLKRVQFLGSVDNNDLPAYYHNAGAFILPSFSETWGLVVNEAMAAGLPVLLSDKANAAQSLLQNGGNGYSFDPFSIAEVTNAIFKYIDLDDGKKRELSVRSLQLISQMDYDNMGIRLVGELNLLNAKKFRKPDIIATAIINLWYGKHDTIAWDKLN